MACRDVASKKLVKIDCPPSLNSFGAADFAPLYVQSEVWWRRRESNPRPRTFRQSFYIHSLCFKFTLPISRRQDSGRISLWRFAPHPISVGEELSCLSDIPFHPTGRDGRDADCP